MRDKRITIKQLFYFYPYKKNIPNNGNTIPQPYIKKEDEVADHPLSVDYNEWKKVVRDYIECVIQVLLTGVKYKLPNSLGNWQLRKYKTKRSIDWKESTIQNKKIYFKNNDAYSIILKWYRNAKHVNFKFKNHWKIRMAKLLGKSIYKSTRKNKNYVYTILDV